MIFELDDHHVTFKSDNYFVAHNATVIGAVTLGDNASIWFNAVLRADNDAIVIGDDSNIQENAVLHTEKGKPLTLGRGVTVAHKVVLHGCTIGDYTLIGINSVILNNVRIGSYCMIGANTLIPEGDVIPDGSLVVGAPGRVIRQLTNEERKTLESAAASYIENTRRFRLGLRPDPRFPQ
jgi:carbonic anhydrase/acetyltransferase-like protein (isoleucine patch superfamily)